MPRLFCNAALSETNLQRLRQGLAAFPDLELVLPGNGFAGSNLVEGPSDPGLLHATVAFGQPNVEDLLKSESVRLVQLTSAGWARYDRDDLKAGLRSRGALLCTASHVYHEPCAEHLVAFMYAQARQLPAAWHNQADGRDWPVGRLRAGSRLLTGQRAILLGYGTIAARVVELLTPLGMELVAFRRTVRGDENVRTLPVSEVDRHLPEADHVLNILPGTAETAGFMNASRLARCRKGSVYYNIGRGTTTDQTALIEALTSGQLAAAYLDVTDPEPLPPDHPLWRAPNCYITPHTAGGYVEEGQRQVEHLLENLRRWRAGEPLLDRVV